MGGGGECSLQSPFGGHSLVSGGSSFRWAVLEEQVAAGEWPREYQSTAGGEERRGEERRKNKMRK